MDNILEKNKVIIIGSSEKKFYAKNKLFGLWVLCYALLIFGTENLGLMEIIYT